MPFKMVKHFFAGTILHSIRFVDADLVEYELYTDPDEENCRSAFCEISNCNDEREVVFVLISRIAHLIACADTEMGMPGYATKRVTSSWARQIGKLAGVEIERLKGNGSTRNGGTS